MLKKLKAKATTFRIKLLEIKVGYQIMMVNNNIKQKLRNAGIDLITFKLNSGKKCCLDLNTLEVIKLTSK